jgi:hypothetical protein
MMRESVLMNLVIPCYVTNESILSLYRIYFVILKLKYKLASVLNKNTPVLLLV